MHDFRDPDDARYDALLRGLQRGRPADFVAPDARPRLALLADQHRMALATILDGAFPRGSYYATALFGPSFLDGVADVLVDLPPGPETYDEKAPRAAKLWSTTCGRDDVAELFAHDAGETARGRYDVAAFAIVLDRFKARAAPLDLVKSYAPSPVTSS